MVQENDPTMIQYKNVLALAPMVRVGELPTRLLALKYDADLVWGPEIIDKKLIGCERIYNEKLKTVDFFTKQQDHNKVRNNLVFRTSPELEKEKLVFQMGTADPVLAVQAAKVIAKDVKAIDVNSGCPKHFSIHSGMGAALLKTPDKLEKILRCLVEEVGIPFHISISVKIRLLETKEETLSLVQRLATTGIRNITIHCRTTTMRTRQGPIRDYLKDIANICHEAGITCIVNGAIKERSELKELTEKYGVDGGMIGSAAEINPTCFRKIDYKVGSNSSLSRLPWQVVAKEFFTIAQDFGNFHVNTKFCLARIIPGKEAVFQQVARSKSMESIETALDGIEDPSIRCTGKRKLGDDNTEEVSNKHVKYRV